MAKYSNQSILFARFINAISQAEELNFDFDDPLQPIESDSESEDDSEYEVTEDISLEMNEDVLYSFPGISAGFLLFARDTQSHKFVSFYRFDEIPSSTDIFIPDASNFVWREGQSAIELLLSNVDHPAHTEIFIFGGQPCSQNMTDCFEHFKRHSIYRIHPASKMGIMTDDDSDDLYLSKDIFRSSSHGSFTPEIANIDNIEQSEINSDDSSLEPQVGIQNHENGTSNRRNRP